MASFYSLDDNEPAYFLQAPLSNSAIKTVLNNDIQDIYENKANFSYDKNSDSYLIEYSNADVLLDNISTLKESSLYSDLTNNNNEFVSVKKEYKDGTASYVYEYKDAKGNICTQRYSVNTGNVSGASEVSVIQTSYTPDFTYFIQGQYRPAEIQGVLFDMMDNGLNVDTLYQASLKMDENGYMEKKDTGEIVLHQPKLSQRGQKYEIQTSFLHEEDNAPIYETNPVIGGVSQDDLKYVFDNLAVLQLGQDDMHYYGVKYTDKDAFLSNVSDNSDLYNYLKFVPSYSIIDMDKSQYSDGTVKYTVKFEDGKGDIIIKQFFGDGSSDVNSDGAYG